MRSHDLSTEDLSRAEFAYMTLKAKFRTGELRAGQRLREAELARLLDISRTPVREALRRIAADGLVQLAAGRGLIVAEFDKQQVRELYALRAVLEGAAAQLAAANALPDETALMRVILDQSLACVDRPAETARLNARFHQVIHEAARNRYLAQALAQMSDSLAILPGTTFEAPGRASVAHAEHHAILDAIERRDSAAAETLARRHIDMAGATRMRMMFDREELSRSAEARSPSPP